MSNDENAADDKERPGSDRFDRARRLFDAEPSERTPQTGLSPVELLSMPQDQRDVVSWLTRQKRASLEEIEQAFPDSDHDVPAILATMSAKGYIRQTEVDGRAYYTVNYRHQKPDSLGRAKNIWDQIAPDSTPRPRKSKGNLPGDET
jgi:hypothetical protein